MPFYSPALAITATDLAPGMLARARQRAHCERIQVDHREADAQALPLPDCSFDTVIASCVFCSVPDPVVGLRELRRVGPNIDRDTVGNVRAAGFVHLRVEDVWLDVMKRVEAHSPVAAPTPGRTDARLPR